MTEPAEAYVQPRRLHITTLVQRVLLTAPGVLLLALPNWRGTGAATGFLLFFGLLAALYLFFVFPLFVAWYLRFEYWITPKELVIRSGLLNRQHRSIPIERIHNVEIQQPLMARLFGTARVIVATAGSKGAEGTLEYVSLREAHDLRRVVREFQRRHGLAPPPLPGTEPAPSTPDRAAALATMPFSRVLLSGVYRFSLLYIFVAFGAIQYLNVDPETLIDWITVGILGRATQIIGDSPWLAAISAAAIAALFSWVVGILVNVNRFYRFSLTREDDKLQRHHGLLTVMEGTIPLKRVQTVLLRANALMRRHGWSSLRLQTMGVDTAQRGHQIAVPFARIDEVLAITPEVLPFQLPEQFEPVSKKTIRRMTIRYTAALLAAVGIGWWFWSDALWLLAGWPLLPALAYLQYRNHGFAVGGDRLFVRRGVFVHYVWVVPISKIQAFYCNATFFQRRLGLATLEVDTAGAAPFAVPLVIDLPDGQALDLLQLLYASSQQLARIPPAAPLPFAGRA